MVDEHCVKHILDGVSQFMEDSKDAMTMSAAAVPTVIPESCEESIPEGCVPALRGEDLEFLEAMNDKVYTNAMRKGSWIRSGKPKDRTTIYHVFRGSGSSVERKTDGKCMNVLIPKGLKDVSEEFEFLHTLVQRIEFSALAVVVLYATGAIGVPPTYTKNKKFGGGYSVCTAVFQK